MKHWIIGSLFLVIVLVAAAGFILWTRAPEALRLKLESEVAENCATCHLHIGGVTLGFGDFEFNEIKFNSGTKGAFETDAEVQSLRGRLSLRSLLHHHVVIHHLVAVEPVVRLTDGDGETPPPPPSDGKDAPEEPSPWTYLLRKAVVENGTFVYTRNHNDTSATLRIHEIHASLDEVGNTPRTVDRISTMSAHFQIEKSGEIELQLGVPFFVKPLHVDVKLKVKDQNLSDLTPFFEPNAGVDLKGFLRHGEATAEVRDKHLKATVLAAYEKFDLTLRKGEDRNGFEAFFTTLGADLVMSKQNLDKSPDKQSSTIESDRKDKQSIVSFILQGLKQAAIKVTRE